MGFYKLCLLNPVHPAQHTDQKQLLNFRKTNRGIYECSKELYTIEMRLEMTTPH